ncbi:MAG: MFS transporter [Isosphaeraceae bacterium]
MSIETPCALDRARYKAYTRLLPLIFLCYVIAYVNRVNVAIAKLTMSKDMPAFDNGVIGFGFGVFFIGYFLLEIPCTLMVEKWSARKLICRIMVTWGIIAALTAFVKTPFQFYAVRFGLGLAEAGFFPGVIVYLTHWFTSRDRARALAWFFVATPIAQIISPKPTSWLLHIGREGNPPILGLVGWQWVYIVWGIPAVVLGVLVFVFLADRPRHASWLEPDECEALEKELEQERHQHAKHMTVAEAFSHPKVLLLTAAYLCVVTGNYGLESFLPSIFEKWYKMKIDDVTWLIIIPPIGSLVGQLFIGWSSDQSRERRLHAAIPILLGVAALCGTLLSRDPLWLIVGLFTVALTGSKAYMPAFWSLPSLFLSGSAAAGSIGLINSVGNLGGFIGPTVLGYVEKWTGSFAGGIIWLAFSMSASAAIILTLGLGHREPVEKPLGMPDESEALLYPGVAPPESLGP